MMKHLELILFNIYFVNCFVRFGDQLYPHAPKRILTSPTMNVVRTKNIILPTNRPQLRLGEVVNKSWKVLTIQCDDFKFFSRFRLVLIYSMDKLQLEMLRIFYHGS